MGAKPVPPPAIRIIAAETTDTSALEEIYYQFFERITREITLGKKE